MGILSRHKREKNKADAFYKSIKQVVSAYFKTNVVFNSDGFHHLQFSAGREREKIAQIYKFGLLQFVPDIVKNSGTIQEYRKQWGKVGRKKIDGSEEMKEVEYWGLIAIVDDGSGGYIKIKVIIRKVGNGNLNFWSVMAEEKTRNGDNFRLAKSNISED